jgi:hypothetical protein
MALSVIQQKEPIPEDVFFYLPEPSLMPHAVLEWLLKKGLTLTSESMDVSFDSKICLF